MKLASDKDSKRIILFKNGRECEMAMLKLSNFFFLPHAMHDLALRLPDVALLSVIIRPC